MDPRRRSPEEGPMTRSPRPTVERAKAKAREQLRAGLDRARGLDFLTPIDVESVGLDPTLVHRSSATSEPHLRAVLDATAGLEGASNLDVGCGKGQAIRVLRRYPFRRVDGIELSPEIAAIARRNLQGRRGPLTEIHVGDACTFDRYADYDALFLYNPFPEPVMEKFAVEVAAQLTGPVTVIYSVPRCGQQLI